MKIEIFKFVDSYKWGFIIIGKNKVQLARSVTLYASKRNALSAAKLLAKGKFKVIVRL